jgi:hypothetical protein
MPAVTTAFDNQDMEVRNDWPKTLLGGLLWASAQEMCVSVLMKCAPL